MGQSFLVSQITNYSLTYYALRQWWWQLLDLNCPPEPNYISKYLFKYPKETDQEYHRRQQRCFQYNIMKYIVEFYTSAICSNKIQYTASTKKAIRADGTSDGKTYKEVVDQYWNACTVRGDCYEDYFRETIVPQTLMWGSLDIFADMPAQPETPIPSRAAEMYMKLDQPYLYIISPLQRTDWRVSEHNNYSYYNSRDVIDIELSPQYGMNKADQYQIWTLEDVGRYTVEHYDKNNKKLDEPVISQMTVKPNPYGIIPAVTVMPLVDMRFYQEKVGESLVKEQLSIQKQLLNVLSLLMDWFVNANYSLMFIKQDTEDGGEIATEDQLKELGNNSALVLQGKGSDAKFLNPDPASAKAMQDFVESMINHMFKLALISTESTESKSHTTQGSIRASYSQLYARLTKLTCHFRKAMEQAMEMELFVAGYNPKDAEFKVQWASDYNFQAYISSLENLAAMRATMSNISKTAVAEYARKSVSSELFDTGKMEQINQEIDEFETKKTPPSTQQQPGNNNQAQGGALGEAKVIGADVKASNLVASTPTEQD